METMGKVLVLKRMLIVLAFLFGSMVTNAQRNWDWDDCIDWFRHEGVELLATYAHPTNNMDDFTIKETYPDIIVEIDFEGTFSDFSSTYKIVRDYKYGVPYFKDVKILSERVLIRSFLAWSEAPRLHPRIYREMELYNLYDGVRNFEELSLGKQAAAALMMEFAVKQ